MKKIMYILSVLLITIFLANSSYSANLCSQTANTLICNIVPTLSQSGNSVVVSFGNLTSNVSLSTSNNIQNLKIVLHNLISTNSIYSTSNSIINTTKNQTQLVIPVITHKITNITLNSSFVNLTGSRNISNNVTLNYNLLKVIISNINQNATLVAGNSYTYNGFSIIGNYFGEDFINHIIVAPAIKPKVYTDMLNASCGKTYNIVANYTNVTINTQKCIDEYFTTVTPSWNSSITISNSINNFSIIINRIPKLNISISKSISMGTSYVYNNTAYGIYFNVFSNDNLTQLIESYNNTLKNCQSTLTTDNNTYCVQPSGSNINIFSICEGQDILNGNVSQNLARCMINFAAAANKSAELWKSNYAHELNATISAERNYTALNQSLKYGTEITNNQQKNNQNLIIAFGIILTIILVSVIMIVIWRRNMLTNIRGSHIKYRNTKNYSNYYDDEDEE